MANYADKAPGVYVEEVASGGAPIAGVGTSTGGFIGLLPADRVMPTNPASGAAYSDAGAGTAVELNSYAEFERAFGKADDFDLAIRPGERVGLAAEPFLCRHGGRRADRGYLLDPAILHQLYRCAGRADPAAATSAN